MKTKNKLTLAFLLASFSLIFVGCNTVDGVGEDVEDLGEEVQDASE